MKIFSNKKICIRKLKKQSGIIAVLICFIMTLTVGVFAAEEQKIELISDGSTAEVIITSPQAAAEEIASLQIALSVTADYDGAEVEFIPNSNLTAKITESRYHSDTGTLNIYIAGTEALFDASLPSLSIGRVTVSSNGRVVTANVAVIEDSLRFVRGGELVEPFGETLYPNAVQITSDNGGNSGSGDFSQSGGSFNTPAVTTTQHTEPAATEAPQETETYAAEETSQDTEAAVTTTEAPRETEQSGAVQDDDPEIAIVANQTTSVEIAAVIPSVFQEGSLTDTEELSAALSIASEFKRDDYTESSFNALTEAMENAKELLSDPYATQEEIDEALLHLQNAIGMLTIKNSPSGAVDEAENGENGENGENNSDENSDTDVSPGEQNGNGEDNTALGSQPGENSESEQSGGSIVVWIIILVVLALVIAAIVLYMNKNKSGKGNNKK